MSKLNAKILKDSYMAWLTEEFVYTDLEKNFVSISTPFIDSDFDSISLYAEFLPNDVIKLTDMGYTIFNLETHGVDINKKFKTRFNILTQIINDFGINFDYGRSNSISLETDLKNFAKAKNRLLQAIMRVNDIEYLSNNKVKSSFNDMVSQLLIDSNINFTPNMEIPVKGIVSPHFDFGIPNNKKGEHLIRTSARPYDINQAKVFNYDVHRVQTTARKVGRFTLLINDSINGEQMKKDVRPTALSDLASELVKITPFSEASADPKILELSSIA